MSTLVTYLRKQSFNPGIASVFINPFFFIRSALYRALKKDSARLSGTLMDFGCGRKPYQGLFTVDQYIGVDLEVTGHDHSSSLVDVFYDGKTLPFADNHFDSIFCSEVVEHVFDPEIILPELFRVLKPGGRILLTVPFCWNEHEVPYDYARYSSFGITHLVSKNGWSVLSNTKTGNFARVIFQLWALYFFELFKKWGKVGYALSLLIIAPINLLGSILIPLFPINNSLYFNNVLLAEKPLLSK
ncbi:MAG: class I SAM-dependent methyltransferase [Chitinophagaceae bacterium]|nr:class I SAM-dependent methyltransferase [Chitinophagaceae bacterium]